MNKGIHLKLLVVVLVAASLWSCENKVKSFTASFTHALDSTDMVEFLKGDSSHRYVFPQDIKAIKKLITPGELSENKSNNVDQPIRIILYGNSQVIGEVSVGLNPGDPIIYAKGNVTMQAVAREELQAYIKSVPF